MKREIEVELPEDIAKDWEVVRIGKPVDGDGVLMVSSGSGSLMAEPWNGAMSGPMPRIILRRKLNPRDWWPKIIIADKMTLEKTGVICLENHSGVSVCSSNTSEILDFSWIPENLRRSGMTIENPWKGEQQ